MVLASLSPWIDPLYWAEVYLRHFDGLVIPARNLTAPPRLPSHPGALYLRIGGPQPLTIEERAIIEVVMARHPIQAVIALRALPQRLKQRFPQIPHWHLVTTGRVPPRAAHVVLARPTPHPKVRAYQLPSTLDSYTLQRSSWLQCLAQHPASHAIVPLSTLRPEDAVLIADDVRQWIRTQKPANEQTQP